MHLLLVHNDYGKFSGEEQAVNTVASVLQAHGHEVSWYRRSSQELEGSIIRQVQAFFSGMYSFDSKNQVKNILSNKSVDLAQVQNLYPLISPSVLPTLRQSGIPVVMRCPNYRLFCPNGLHMTHGRICERCLGGREWNCVLFNCEESLPKSLGYAMRNAFARMTRMIIDNVTLFVVLSEFQKQRFINGGIEEDKLEVLPNVAHVPIEPDKTAAIGEHVAFVGRLSPEKGIEVLLHTARGLSNVPFSIAGSTERMPGIRSSAPPNVQFYGFLSDRKLEQFYARSRIVVFPSLWFEGFPNGIATAMAYGKPVVASRLGAIPEIVDDGSTGLLFEPGNVDDLIEKIDYLWRRPELCHEMGKTGLIKAKTVYSEERFYERLMGIYEKALAYNVSIGS